jgi:hypothetical protein
MDIPDSPHDRIEEILARVGSGYGREQLVRLALRCACDYIIQMARFPEGTTPDGLALSFLQDAAAQLNEIPLAEGEVPDA